MILALLASQAVLFQSDPTSGDPLRLGGARNAFGELPANETLRDVYRYSGFGIGKDGALIIFPEGRADERFYLQSIDLAPNSSRARMVPSLVCETKQNGVIKPMWYLLLHQKAEKAALQARKDGEPGTLLKFLRSAGLAPNRRPSNVIAATLEAQSGYAIYTNYNHGSKTPGIWYWYIDSHGKRSSTYSHPLSLGPDDPYFEFAPGRDLGYGFYLPRFGFPYPITVEEQLAGKQRGKEY